MKGLYVSRPLFEQQLKDLSRNQFSTPEYDSVLTVNETKAQIFLSFDDGFESVLRHGAPLLEKHGFRAIQFLVAGNLGKINDWETSEGEAEERLMDPVGVREWLAAGNEIGSHTITHPRLTQIPPDAALEEIASSKKRLEDEFGVPIRHFCYPFGDHDERTVDLVRSAGYVTASTTIPGLNQPTTDPFKIRRIMARRGSRRWPEMRQRWALRIRRWFPGKQHHD